MYKFRKKYEVTKFCIINPLGQLELDIMHHERDILNQNPKMTDLEVTALIILLVNQIFTSHYNFSSF